MNSVASSIPSAGRLARSTVYFTATTPEGGMKSSGRVVLLQQSPRDRGRPGRGALVSRVERQQDLAHHNRWGGHPVPRVDREESALWDRRGAWLFRFQVPLASAFEG